MNEGGRGLEKKEWSFGRESIWIKPDAFTAGNRENSHFLIHNSQTQDSPAFGIWKFKQRVPAF